MQFGMVLRLLRKRNNLTQRQLADTLGVSESRIGMYERCQREPDFEMLEAIADYFNVDMDYLTGRSDVERQYSFDPATGAATRPVSDEDIKAAFWGGERDLSQEEIDALWAETKDYIAFRTAQRKKKKK